MISGQPTEYREKIMKNEEHKSEGEAEHVDWVGGGGGFKCEHGSTPRSPKAA